MIFLHRIGVMCALAVVLGGATVAAVEVSDAAVIAAVSAVDDERVAASIAMDRARLEAVLSDELRYAHSNGMIDTKASYIDSIISGRSVYRKFDYAERTFKVIAPGVITMSGRALIDARSGEQAVALDLNFLAVWRLEGSVWRFVAWQSSRNPPPAQK